MDNKKKKERIVSYRVSPEQEAYLEKLMQEKGYKKMSQAISFMINNQMVFGQ